MKCPHCSINFHDNWSNNSMMRFSEVSSWAYRTAVCPNCKHYTIELYSNAIKDWKRVYPERSSRDPTPVEVPATIATDYNEACLVLPISPKASAALSRRCLQNILRSNGYTARDLAGEIDLLLNETDPRKAIPSSLREAVDAIRNFGNFSAHPITDKTQLQIIEVEAEEAEWCLEIIEEMFQHFYVKPAQIAARKAALNAKLQAAGKPPAK